MAGGENRLEEQLPRRSLVMLFEEHVPNERLRRVRHLEGWTQSELAERLDTDFETISRWERGITVLSTRTLRKQGAENQRKAWQEAIRTAQAVLLIASPEARSSRHVQKALQLAGVYKSPICTVWVDGESWQECIPPDCCELFA